MPPVFEGHHGKHVPADEGVVERPQLRKIIFRECPHRLAVVLLDRCWREGEFGGGMHAVLCGAGYTPRMILAHLGL